MLECVLPSVIAGYFGLLILIFSDAEGHSN